MSANAREVFPRVLGAYGHYVERFNPPNCLTELVVGKNIAVISKHFILLVSGNRNYKSAVGDHTSEFMIA